MNSIKITSINQITRKYMTVIMTIAALGMMIAALIGRHAIEENQLQQEAYEKTVIEQYLEKNIDFYQSMVDSIAEQQAVRDVIALEDESRATELALLMQRIIPDSIGVAFFSKEGNVLGGRQGVRVGEQCLADIQHILHGDSISQAPVHRENPELAHFDITTPILDENSDIIGVVFVSFSLNVLNRLLWNIEQPGIKFRLLDANKEIIAQGSAEDSVFETQNIKKQKVPGTSWNLIYTDKDYDSGVPLLIAGGIFALMGIGILSVSFFMSFRLAHIFNDNFRLIKDSLENTDTSDSQTTSTGILLKDVKGVMEETRSIIKEKEAISHALAEREKRYRILTEENSDVIWAIDPAGKYTYVNPAIEKRLGYKREEILGQSVEILLAEESKSLFRQSQQYIMEHAALPQKSFEFQMIASDGSKVWVEAIPNILFDDDGNPVELMGISRDVTQRKTLERALTYMAYNDDLTGLYNRAKFFEQLELEIKRASRDNNLVGLLFIDLDKFKDVNDTFGHEAGDVLLKQVAERLQDVLRETDTIARIGGDEFTVILSTGDSEEGIESVASKVKKAICEPFQVNEFTCNIGASIGISIYPKDSENPEVLLKIADQDMYDNKNDPSC
jgi:diguanylate cyclase (GGDEF)-like protein/PAS domain S-box-containing protein